MKYQRMKFSQLLKELDSEEKARTWIWLAKFDGKEFVCPKCTHENFYQHKKIQKLGNAKVAICIFDSEQTQFFSILKLQC